MNSWRTLIYRYVRCCLHCGSLMPNQGLLCSCCEKNIGPLQEYEDLSLPFVKTLYRWVPNQSDILSTLMLHLKGSRQKWAWHYYAAKFLRIHLFSEPRNYRRIIIVPAPAKTKSPDHAYFWAQALAAGLGALFLPCLQRIETDNSYQRVKGRAERDQIRFEVCENSTLPMISSLETLWVFADDIYTTGATARAAYEALGSPVNFEVWALSKRSLSCGASKVLL